MSITTTPSTNGAPYVGVFWGTQFEGEIASTFITELRRASIRTKLIGTTGLVATGVDDLTLTADLTIDDPTVHAQYAHCIVLPCDLSIFTQMMESAHTREFLLEAAEQNATFVGTNEVVAQIAQRKTADKTFDWIYDDERGRLVDFARQVSTEL